MFILYVIATAIITTLGLLYVIKPFLIPKGKGNLGLTLFGLIFFVHDSFLMLFTELDSVPIKCIEFFVVYIIVYLVIKVGFQGSSVKNFVWIYGANFVYQAIGTVIAAVIFGVVCDFDYMEIERMGDEPSFLNCIILGITCAIGGIVGAIIMQILLKRNNRIIQAILRLLAAVGILAGVVNSVENVYVIIPIMIITLIAGMIYQDKILRVAEEQEKYYKQLEERQRIRQEELAKIRHDLANHLNMIHATGSEKYAQEVLSKIDKEIKCGEPIIDCLLEEKEQSCREKDIELQEQWTNLSGSAISNFEWVSLLANLFDNAIEACEKTCQTKKIEITIKRNRDYAIISMTNSKCIDDTPIENKFRTTKTQKQNHGYGTKIIKDIVDKYEGRIRYEDTGNQMYTYITLKAW